MLPLGERVQGRVKGRLFALGGGLRLTHSEAIHEGGRDVNRPFHPRFGMRLHFNLFLIFALPLARCTASIYRSTVVGNHAEDELGETLNCSIHQTP